MVPSQQSTLVASESACELVSLPLGRTPRTSGSNSTVFMFFVVGERDELPLQPLACSEPAYSYMGTDGDGWSNWSLVLGQQVLPGIGWRSRSPRTSALNEQDRLGVSCIEVKTTVWVPRRHPSTLASSGKELVCGAMR